MRLAGHIETIRIIGFWQRLYYVTQLDEVVAWFERVYYCHHNARVIADFEHRMSVVLMEATGGRMSKPYYDIETMRPQIQDAFGRERDDGYNEAIEHAAKIVEPIHIVSGSATDTDLERFAHDIRKNLVDKIRELKVPDSYR
jgi:hypothetical protein